MKVIAKEHAQLALSPGLPSEERRELRQASWMACMEKNLNALNKTQADLATKPRKQDWKMDLACRIRKQSGASIAWLAERLQLGGAATLRGYFHHFKREKN